MYLYNADIRNNKAATGEEKMKNLLNIGLKNIGSLAICILFLSANTTSGWIAHQPELPKEMKKFKR